MMIKKILKNSSAIYFYQGLALVFGMLTNIIIARYFGSEMKGRVDLFLLISGIIVEFTILGIGSSVIRFRAKLHYPLHILHGIVIYYVYFLFFVAIWIAILLYILSVNIIYIVGILIVPLILYKQISNSIFISLDKAVVMYKMNFYIAFVLAVVTFGLYISKILTIENYIILYSIISIIICVGIYSFIKSFHKQYSIQFDYAIFKKIIAFGFIIYLGAIVNIAHFKVDQFMISSMLSLSDLGIYTISVRWAEMIFFIDTAIVSTVLFKLTSGDRNNAYELAYLSSFIIASFGVVFFVIFFFFSDKLIIFLYGEEYKSAVKPLIYLIPGVVFWSLSKPLSAYLVFQLGQTYKITIASFIGLVLNIILNYFFIYKFKLIGVALSSSISYLIVMICIMFFYIQNREVKNE